MKQNFKRFLSWTLALLMALSLLPAGLLTVPAHAEELVDELVNDAQAEEFTVQAARVAVTFLPPEAPGCSFNADDQNFSKDSSQRSINGNSIPVQVFPAAGYRFLGWYYVTNSVVAAEPFSTVTDGTLTFEQSCTVTARFETMDTATFKVGNETFTGLQAAIDDAQGSSDKTITLTNNGSIYGNYTIPEGITLLIPFDAAGTVYTNKPGYITEKDTYETPSVFKKLTMEDGASIVVKGAISVGGKHYTCSQAQSCKTTGPYGQIQMEAGSSITLESRANLYAWGYITGDGQITANSGAKVYEYFQIMDWRGGSCTSDMEGNEKKVFPFSQYYVQNIEAELTIQAGASEKAYLTVYAANGFIIKSVFIDYVGEGGLFSLKGNGTFTKKYDPKKDRIIFKITGDAELSKIQLKIKLALFGETNIQSSAYVLPINNNVDMQILSGTTTVSEDAALLPGVTVSIAKGAELKVADSASLYVYAAEQWRKAYVQGSNNFGISPVVYSPSRQGDRTVSDATIDVNGTLTAAGAIYTTEGGANICSSKGAGVYVQQGQRGKSSETYQCIQKDKTPNYTAIPITPAKLRNEDGRYVETEKYPQGSKIKYEYNAWGGKPAAITVSFDANGGFGTMSAQRGTAGQNITLPSNCFTYADHTFTGWNTAANGTGTAYDDGATASFAEDTILYAQWTQKPVVTFSANGGDGSMSPQTVEPNAATTLIVNAFTRADYDFTGWNTAADGTGTAYADQAAVTLSGNCTLYAQWTLHKYHVRWLNWDGSVLQEGYYTCKEEAAWDWANDDPTRPEDENYTYEFANRWVPWDSQTDGWGFHPHKDVDFTAQFKQFEKLTVTFDAGGGTGTMDSVKILNGSSGTYYTLPKCGFTAPKGKLFDGWLITGTVGYNQFEQYELSNEPWDEESLLAFSNLILKASWKDCNHAWNNGTVTTAATCTSTGVKTFTCSVCKETKTEDIPASGHTGGRATCKEKAKCETCGEEYGALDPANHAGTETDWIKTENTHKETYRCCGAVKTEEAAHTFGEWSDGKHTCSICGYEAKCGHNDANKDHKCDICGKTLSECLDANKDHKCDICSKTLSECADANNDHKCDICGKTLSECLDENKDHDCDICGKTLSECADNDKDHKCDICGKVLSECLDANKDHKCDICGKTLSECLDENKDHKCDICGKTLSECLDENKDHKCDICGKVLSECLDENKDHKCDICGKELSAHTFGDWRVTKAADYVTPGEKTHTCSVCNATETGAIPSILQQLQEMEINKAEDGYTMTLPTGKKVLVLLAGYSQVGQLKSIQMLSADANGKVTFTRPDSEKAMLFFLQEDYKPLCSRKVTQ